MSELPLPAVIGWLVHERYGGYDAETKVHGHMQHILPEQAADAATLKEHLRRLPPDRVRQMLKDRLLELIPEANAAIEDRESVLFFNRPAALANYDYWARAPIWSVAEAVSLLLGRDPLILNWAAFEKEHATATPFAATYRQLGELIYRSVQAGILSEPIEPKPFIEWCRKSSLTVPEQLVSSVEALRGRLVDWPKAFLKLSEMYQEAQSDLRSWAEAHKDEVSRHNQTLRNLGEIDAFAAGIMEELHAEREQHEAELRALREEHEAAVRQNLSTRERDSILKLLIAAAVEGLGYVPAATRSPIPKELASATERLGIPISDGTALKWLREAAELLPPEVDTTAA